MMWVLAAVSFQGPKEKFWWLLWKPWIIMAEVRASWGSGGGGSGSGGEHRSLSLAAAPPPPLSSRYHAPPRPAPCPRPGHRPAFRFPPRPFAFASGVS